MRACDLFCGAGGMSQGLRDSGISVEMGIDNDRQALSVYNMHHTNGTCMDLSDEDAAVDAISALGHLDMLAGSPPCQDFSIAGTKKTGKRASLTVSFARIATRVRTRIILMENVGFMARSSTWEEAKNVLLEGGYSVHCLRVNSACCGVPQVRRRMFIVGALGKDMSILKLLSAGFRVTPAHPPKVKDFLPIDTYYLPGRNVHSYSVHSADKPAPTLRCNCLQRPYPSYMPRHDDAGPVQDAHTLSVSDAAVLASFPKAYFADTKRVLAARLIGNSVPPNVAKEVGRWCKVLFESSDCDMSAPVSYTPSLPRPTRRRGRIDRLVQSGILGEGGSVLESGELAYVSGDSERGDDIVEEVMSVRLSPGTLLRVLPRRNATVAQGHAPVDDLRIHVQGIKQPFRTVKQLKRYLHERETIST